VIGRASQRYDHIHPLKTGKQLIEPHRVFGSEPAGQQVPCPVEIVELGLQADHFGRRFPEGEDRLAELVLFGPILRIEDHQVLAEGVGEPVVASSWFSGRTHRRHHRHVKAVREVHVGRRIAGLDVVFLQEELHVETVVRIVEALNAVDKLSK
jgi:hypothetical protein